MEINNLALVTDNKSKSTNVKYRLYLAALDDCDVENWPAATAGKITTSPLKEGKKFVYVDARIGSINPTSTPGDNAMEQQLTLTPSIEGLTDKTLDWFYKANGNRFVAVWERCVDGTKFIGGSPCSGGLLLTSTNIGTLDGNSAGIALQLQGNPCPEPFYVAGFELDVKADPIA